MIIGATEENGQNRLVLNSQSAAGGHLSLSLLAAILILSLSLAAGTSLWVLVRLYNNAFRSASAISGMRQGIEITRRLAAEPIFSDLSAGPREYDQFDQIVELLERMEDSLGYVTIMENGAVLYHRESRNIAASDEPSPGAGIGDKVFVGRKKLASASRSVPLITFEKAQVLEDGRERRIEMGLKKELLEKEHAGAASAIRAMHLASLTIIGIAFALCLIIVFWLVRREANWQKRLRQDEQLALAGAIAGSVLHDFRNPLSAIQLDAQILKEEAERGAEKGRLISLADRISKTVLRTDGLLKEFLLTSNPQFAATETFDVNDCVADCVELINTKFKKAGINLTLDLEKRTMPAHGSSAHLKRALLNILNNAEQFAPPSSTVSIKTYKQGGDKLVVAISDEGPGIPTRTERRRVFELFFSKRPGGTGLGLAMARAGIETCGGTVRCDQRLSGRGCSFVIELPERHT